MASWAQFCAEAPHVSDVFARRHRATESLCMLGTIRADGSPRISPIEPTIFEGQLLLVGMPGTLKFADLTRDPRFTLHTATVDPQVGDGDAKLSGTVQNMQDRQLHDRFTDHLYQERGLDFRSDVFDPFFVADLTEGSSLELVDNRLRITVWRPGQGERVVLKD